VKFNTKNSERVHTVFLCILFINFPL